MTVMACPLPGSRAQQPQEWPREAAKPCRAQPGSLPSFQGTRNVKSTNACSTPDSSLQGKEGVIELEADALRTSKASIPDQQGRMATRCCRRLIPDSLLDCHILHSLAGCS